MNLRLALGMTFCNKRRPYRASQVHGSPQPPSDSAKAKVRRSPSKFPNTANSISWPKRHDNTPEVSWQVVTGQVRRELCYMTKGQNGAPTQGVPGPPGVVGPPVLGGGGGGGRGRGGGGGVRLAEHELLALVLVRCGTIDIEGRGGIWFLGSRAHLLIPGCNSPLAHGLRKYGCTINTQINLENNPE